MADELMVVVVAASLRARNPEALHAEGIPVSRCLLSAFRATSAAEALGYLVTDIGQRYPKYQLDDFKWLIPDKLTFPKEKPELTLAEPEDGEPEQAKPADK